MVGVGNEGKGNPTSRTEIDLMESTRRPDLRYSIEIHGQAVGEVGVYIRGNSDHPQDYQGCGSRLYGKMG